MPLPTPAPGLVISYSYLWRDQTTRGETEGRKSRPCAIVLVTLDDDGDTVVFVAPVTHNPPTKADETIAIPASVKRSPGLDHEPSWIVTSELNRFVWPGFDLRPVARDKPDLFCWGFLPVELFEAVKQGIARNHRAQRLRPVDRDR